jgi:hypothetical protein
MAKQQATAKKNAKTLMEKISDQASHLKEELIAGKDHLVELGAEKIASVKTAIKDYSDRKKKAAKKSAPKKSAPKKSVTKKSAPKKATKKPGKKAAKKSAPKKAAKKKSAAPKKKARKK